MAPLTRDSARAGAGGWRCSKSSRSLRKVACRRTRGPPHTTNHPQPLLQSGRNLDHDDTAHEPLRRPYRSDQEPYGPACRAHRRLRLQRHTLLHSLLLHAARPSMATAMESWDDDDDLQGDFQAFGMSVGTAQSISSRLSIRSESVAGDDDWNLVLQPDDEQSTNNALQSAKHAGIPLPSGITSSALLGGTIKRLGKKTTRQKVEDDWDNDMDLGEAPLTLKPRAAEPLASFGDDDDGFDDFEGDFEGSLGTRFAGTKHDARESSVSVMSPSIGSPTAEESDQDEAGGLDIPDGPLDFDAILKKRRATEAALSEASAPSPAIEQPATLNTHKKSKLLADTNEDFLDGLDFSGLPSLNVQKRTFNKNVKIKDVKQQPASPAQRASTTLNFHDKPIDRPTHMRSHLPRPVSGTKPHSRLEPVLENGTSTITRERRNQVASGNSALLRNKRSAPALRSQSQQSSIARPPLPVLPSGASLMQATHASAQRAMPYHIRRESDPNNRRGAQSPPMRSHSRLSNAFVPDTPSRVARLRPDLAPAALAREAQAKKNLTKPSRRRNFGDGTELEHFDDLRTNTEKESKFTKQPVARGPPKLGIRHAHSRSDVKDPTKRPFTYPDRMTTPAPPKTPASPTRGFPDRDYTPSYLRDTAASRIARESRVVNNNPRPRSEGPMLPVSTNWKAQIAARSPHTSPSAQKQRPKKIQPQLIKGIGIHIAKSTFTPAND